VGTRFKGFVVKTRKANQHSNRRVKYWAKVSSTKAKPKKASQASKSSTSSTRNKVPKRRKLKGGDTAQVHAILEDLRSGGAGLIERSRCATLTTRAIKVYGKQAQRIPDDAKLIEGLMSEETKVYKAYERHHNSLFLDKLNAIAIIMANVRLAQVPYPAQNSTIEVEAYGKGLQSRYSFKYAPTDNVYDLVQSEMPVFIGKIRDQSGLDILRSAKFGNSRKLLLISGEDDDDDYDDPYEDYR
jgi:hypothetical protein